MKKTKMRGMWSLRCTKPQTREASYISQWSSVLTQSHLIANSSKTDTAYNWLRALAAKSACLDSYSGIKPCY